jgi:hypothetical protein
MASSSLIANMRNRVLYLYNLDKRSCFVIAEPLIAKYIHPLFGESQIRLGAWFRCYLCDGCACRSLTNVSIQNKEYKSLSYFSPSLFRKTRHKFVRKSSSPSVRYVSIREKRTIWKITSGVSLRLNKTNRKSSHPSFWRGTATKKKGIKHCYEEHLGGGRATVSIFGPRFIMC